MKRHFNFIAIGIALGAVILFIFACGPAVNPTSNVANVTPPIAPTKSIDDLAAGRELYTQNCAACHRDAGTGGKITIDGKGLDPDDLTSEKMKNRSDKKLFENIVEGVSDEGMPAFKEKLTESQIKETIRFIRAGLQKLPATPTQ